MAESTALAEHRDVGDELHDLRTAGPGEPAAAAGATAQAGPLVAGQPRTDELMAEELLVEEVSIDGMCGVY